MNDEDVLNIRLTGKEVHKAVANFVKDQLHIHPQKIIDASVEAARQAAKETVDRYVRDNLTGDRNLEWYFRQAITRYIESEVKVSSYRVLESVATKIAGEYRDKIEAEVRRALAGEVDSIIAKAVSKK